MVTNIILEHEIKSNYTDEITVNKKNLMMNNLPKIAINSVDIEIDENKATQNKELEIEEQVKNKFKQKENEENMLFQNINVFDFIHSVQLNFESSQLDKENSHFIIADLAIASNELIKTQKLLTEANYFPYSNDSSNQNYPISINRVVSNAIKINNQSISSSHIKSLEDRSLANSFIMRESPSDNLVFNSNFVSPNENNLSSQERKKSLTKSEKKHMKMSQSLSTFNSRPFLNLNQNTINTKIDENKVLKLNKSISSIDTVI